MQSFNNCFPKRFCSIQHSAKTDTAVIYHPRNGVVPEGPVLQPFCLSVSLAPRHLWPTHFAMMGTEFLIFFFFCGKSNLNFIIKLKMFSGVQEVTVWQFPCDTTLSSLSEDTDCFFSCHTYSKWAASHPQKMAVFFSKCLRIQIEKIGWHGGGGICCWFPSYVYVLIIPTTESKM